MKNLLKKYRSIIFFVPFLFGIGIMGFKTVNSEEIEHFSDTVKKPVHETIRIRQETQKSEDDWALEKEKLLARYDALTHEHKRLVEARADLRKDIASNTEAVLSLEKKISEISRISIEIRPYLNMVFDRLKALVDDGAPFLMQERRTRIQNLHRILDDPQVSISEKYRKTTEAVLIEAEYGNSVEVYPQQIFLEEREIQANIFRLGRVSLFFQSLDQTLTGYFNVGSGRWQILPKKYNRDINTAIEIGAKRRPVDLVNLPLGRISLP